MTEPTQQQIALAQQAGDKAYAEAEAKGRHPSICHDAYIAALNEELDRQEREAVEVNSRIAYTDQRVADVQPLADETMRRWHAYVAGLTDDEIALMQAMTRETAHDDAKDDATGRPW